MLVFESSGWVERGEIEVHGESVKPQFDLFSGFFAEFEELYFFLEGELTTHNFDK